MPLSVRVAYLIWAGYDLLSKPVKERATRTNWRLQDTETGRVLVRQLAIAQTKWECTRGLLGCEQLGPDEGLLIPHCACIHMWFMRFAIDAVFLDADGRVHKIVPDLRPWRISWAPGAHDVVELPSGAAALANIRLGQQVITLPPVESER